jgi:acetyl-CoA C-acetyltransferase
MHFNNVAIPAGMAWSSPFVKWQGSLSELHSIDLAADVTGRALAERNIKPGQIDGAGLRPGCAAGRLPYGRAGHR